MSKLLLIPSLRRNLKEIPFKFLRFYCERYQHGAQFSVSTFQFFKCRCHRDFHVFLSRRYLVFDKVQGYPTDHFREYLFGRPKWSQKFGLNSEEKLAFSWVRCHLKRNLETKT